MITPQNNNYRNSEKHFSVEATCLLSAAARKHLRQLKGAKLAVLISLLLRCNDEGRAEADILLLERETGYKKHSVETAVNGLCKLKVEGQRLMLIVPERKRICLANKIHFLLLPTEADILRHKG